MSFLGIDLGGTKLATGVFSPDGELLRRNEIAINNASGAAVGKLITDEIDSILHSSFSPVQAIGISVPGISNIKSGTVWAPNIPGWEDYHLLDEVKSVAPGVDVSIESDRSCYILGEMWKGNAKGCSNAIFIAVGTGIGAGIIADGHIIHGANDIAGSIGWMALQHPYREEFRECGCFETYASGTGIGQLARKMIYEDDLYNGLLNKVPVERITSQHVFEVYDDGDPVAHKVIGNAIQFWGMAIANLVSIFNPEKIIMGGGVFGPAVRFIPDIYNEAKKWAQPISMTKVSIEPSAIGGDAGIFGAGYLALRLHQMK